MMYRRYLVFVAVLAVLVVGACAKKKPPVARPTPPPPSSGTDGRASAIPARAGAGASAGSRRADCVGYARGVGHRRAEPQFPVSAGLLWLDEDTIDEAGQQALNANAALMKKYPSWIVTIEGHSDERGTAEYNLALGERRALAARNYLVSLGIPADRLRTISYGKEFPFEPGHEEGILGEESARALRGDEQVAVPGCGFGVPGSGSAFRVRS